MVRVLIVDDARTSRSVLEYSVGQLPDYQIVQSLESARNAIAFCDMTPVDLVIMDIYTAQGESGLEAAAQIKKKHPRVKIIMVTSLPEESFIQKAKDKNDPFRLMGFGHRVYKTYDPRAEIIKKECHMLLETLEIKDSLLDVAYEVERAAMNDEYFVERHLYPNVDFYTGIVYRAIGIPEDMFTVMFALARLPGWIAHWKEMIGCNTRIVRPRQVYVGNPLTTIF